jgi:hypothetical protein
MPGKQLHSAIAHSRFACRMAREMLAFKCMILSVTLLGSIETVIHLK